MSKAAVHKITILPVLNGYVVNVGCSSFVFESSKSLLKALEKYLDSPAETEQEMINNSINSGKFSGLL